MGKFVGTTNNDVIDGPKVASNNDWIDPLAGDDTVTLGANQTFVSGPGNDIVIGTGTTSQYALWFATEAPYVDLAQGYALDGFGGRDQLSGIGTVHMSGLGGAVIGDQNAQTVFAFGGKKTIDLGGGVDRLIYYQQASTGYDISRIGSEWQIRNIASGLVDSVKNVEFIEFSDKTIDVAYDDASIRADFRYTAYSFVESGMSPAYVYAGVTYPAAQISWFAQAAYTIDLDGDGKLDLVAPMNKGYASGLDTRVPFVALSGASGALTFSSQINAAMPVTAGARRAADIYLENAKTNAVVTVAHDTGDGELADLTIVTQKLASGFFASDMPALPASSTVGRALGVNAHSMAVGDINGDGTDDILVGDWASNDGMYALLQQADGKFVINKQAAYASIIDWPLEGAGTNGSHNLLVDLDLVDVNGDGYADLVAGWGHGSAHGYVFLNSHGTFSVDNKIALPDSLYGKDNQLHMKTFHTDFDGDGDTDLAILWSRFEPYYGGNYIQLLDNDGTGHFTDVTTSRIDKPAQDALGRRLQWTDYWQLLDVNADGAVDIVGQRTGSSSAPVIYLNNGKGSFSVIEVLSNGKDVGAVIRWADFDRDGALELMSLRGSQVDATGTSTVYEFNVFELGGSAIESALARTEKKGTELADVLVGTAHDDVLAGAGGRDTIDGGAGKDTVVFAGKFSDYTVASTNSTTMTVDAKVTASKQGHDVLANVELLKFADFTVAIDTSGNAGQAYRIYQAAFNRTPDASGLGFWINALDHGATLRQVADGFVGSGEFKSVYGINPTNAQIIDKFYQNVLHRAGEGSGVAYWTGVLDKHADTVAGVLAGFSESAENQAALIGTLQHGIAYTAYA